MENQIDKLKKRILELETKRDHTISIGDISVTSSSTKNCRQNIKLLFKDPQIQKYLKINEQQKIIKEMAYCG